MYAIHWQGTQSICHRATGDVRSFAALVDVFEQAKIHYFVVDSFGHKQSQHDAGFKDREYWLAPCGKFTAGVK